MKGECAGRPIREYVGLRPKMCSILPSSGANIKKAKGVKKIVVKQEKRHSKYKECLFSNQIFRQGMNTLRSLGQQSYGQHLNKVSLSQFDSKRFILDYGVDTPTYGCKH